MFVHSYLSLWKDIYKDEMCKISLQLSIIMNIWNYFDNREYY